MPRSSYPLRSAEQRRQDALAIWNAGVEAVSAERLVRETVHTDGRFLLLAEAEPIDLSNIDRIVVVGGGKAGAGMARGIEAAIGRDLAAQTALSGWINVPANCIPNTTNARTSTNGPRIHLHAARPAEANEPTAAGVIGAQEILRTVSALGSRDLCICLISGGGSALLPAPIDGITVTDKVAVARRLSAAGATIEQMNTVRKHLSQIKGGGLARHCTAGRMVSLIISDVLGDPLDIIASGPTVPDSSTPADALNVLHSFGLTDAPEFIRIVQKLQRLCRKDIASERAFPSTVSNHIIGNNAVAVDAAGMMAEKLGYSHAMVCANRSEGLAEDVGRHLAETGHHMRTRRGPDCLISGGEPVVQLARAGIRGLGGRNQQLALAAAIRLEELQCEGVTILSGGTDGEDGPTDAAGALIDETTFEAARRQELSPTDHLARNDAYHFFAPIEGLIRTGPTHTNVCDVRVVLVDRNELSADR